MSGKKSRSSRHSNPSGFNQGGGDEGSYGDEYPAAEGAYPPAVQPSYHIDPVVPRSYQDGDGIADLTSGMGQLQMEGPSAYENYDQYPNGYPVVATQDGTDGGHSAYTQYNDQPQYPGEYYAAGDKGKQPAGADGAPDPTGGYASYNTHYHAETQEDNDYQRAIHESQQTAIWGTPCPSGDAGPSTYGDVEDEPEYIQPPSSLSPYAAHSGSFMITDEHNFVSDPRYKREHSRKYQPGAVFKTLWAEPHGQAPTAEDHPVSEAAASVRSSLKNFYIGIRRFIVVASDHGHSSCVPILTYDQRGCKKPGIDPLQHGIIHTKGSHPHQLRGEPNMGFAPVALDMSVREKLAKQSRVNYSKIVTVEHVTKVYFIGHIRKDDLKVVKQAVDTCWLNKDHGTY